MLEEVIEKVLIKPATLRRFRSETGRSCRARKAKVEVDRGSEKLREDKETGKLKNGSAYMNMLRRHAQPCIKHPQVEPVNLLRKSEVIILVQFFPCAIDAAWQAQRQQ